MLAWQPLQLCNAPPPESARQNWTNARSDATRRSAITLYFGGHMADLYLKALESERKSLWAACRLKGLAKHTPERQRIAEIDDLLEAHKAKKTKSS